MNGHREWSALADDEIRDRGSQRSSRNICIATAKSKPHTARQQRRVITGKLREMGKNIVPRIYKRSAFAIRGTLRFLLIEMVQLRIHGLFAYIACSGRNGGNLFSLTTGKTLTFHRRHGAAIDRSKQIKVFKRESTVKKGKWRKCLC